MNTNNETSNASKTDEKEYIYTMYNNTLEFFISTLELLKNVTCKKLSDTNIHEMESILDNLRSIKTSTQSTEKFEYADARKILDDKIDEMFFQNDENICANCCKKAPRMKGGKYRVQFAEELTEVTLKDMYDSEVQTSVIVFVDNFTSTYLDQNYENNEFVDQSKDADSDTEGRYIEPQNGMDDLTSLDVHEEGSDQNNSNVTVIHATGDSESDLEKIPSQVEKSENNNEETEACSCEVESLKSQSKTSNRNVPQEQNTPQDFACDPDCSEAQNEADVPPISCDPDFSEAQNEADIPPVSCDPECSEPQNEADVPPISCDPDCCEAQNEADIPPISCDPDCCEAQNEADVPPISCDPDCCEAQNEADVSEWDSDDEQVCNVQNLIDVQEKTGIQERLLLKDLQNSQRREQELCKVYRSIIVEDDDDDDYDELPEDNQDDIKAYQSTCPFYNQPTEHVQLGKNFVGYKERPLPQTYSPPTYTYYQKCNFDPRSYVEPNTQKQYIQKPPQRIPIDERQTWKPPTKNLALSKNDCAKMHLNNLQQYNQRISKITDFEKYTCAPIIQCLNFPQVFCSNQPPTIPLKSCNVQGHNKSNQTFDLFPISFCKKLGAFKTKETQTYIGEESLKSGRANKNGNK